MPNQSTAVRASTSAPSASATSQLLQGFSGLKLLNPQLPERALAFVVHGKHPEILLELRALPGKAGALLGKPGALGFQIYHVMDDSAERQAMEASRAGRHAFYQSVDPDAPDLPLLVRLGKLLEAADHGQDLDHTGASMPDWLEYLLNDALGASFGNIDRTLKRDPAHRPAWDIGLIAAILDHEELPRALALPIVFERRGLDKYFQGSTYERLLQPLVLDEYMLAHPQAVSAAAQALSAAGRTLLAKRIGQNPALLNELAALMIALAVSDSKTVRDAASGHLAGIDRQICVAVLGQLLREGDSSDRANAAELLARSYGDAALPLLEQALEQESSKPVQQQLRNALARLGAAGDAGALELPLPPVPPPLPQLTLGDDAIELLLANRAELLESLRKDMEEEAQRNLSSTHKFVYSHENYLRYQQLNEDQLRQALAALNGQGGEAALALLGDWTVDQTLRLGGRLEARADFGVRQLLRWTLRSDARRWGLWYNQRFQTWLRKQDKRSIDLRQINELIIECGGADVEVPLACLEYSWSARQTPQLTLPADSVWPLFAAAPHWIDEGLGLTAPEVREDFRPFDLASTLSLLAIFPSIPARWLPRVLEFALGESKTHRAAAQQALSRQPDIGLRVCQALGSGKQEVRIEAARWLERLDYRAGVPALYKALDKESRETVSAELLTALEKLGEDLGPRLAPEVLLAQARKGLKGKAPAGLAWLALDALPACRWADGTPVEAEIVRWWVILACKLKEPAGNALLERYLGLLAAPDRAALGAFLLHQFIAHDTMGPPLEEATALAQANAQGEYDDNQRMAKQYPEYYAAAGELTLEQVFEQIKRRKLAEYIGTAINEKGILGLISGVPGHELVSTLQQYIRNHYPRRAQVESLLEAACVSNEASVIQFTLEIARRYRTASVQEKARMLVQRIAERNGWTEDELADRTVPTGGLDDSGRLTLDYGSRTFTVVLDAAMKPVLQNADGKAIGALPAPRQDDPADAIREAKQLLATCKKELKQVITMQGARLYDAMCGSRQWPAAEWREYLQQHPIVGRLVQRLVWIARAADGGEQQFRPTEDGSLIDNADEEITLAADARVSLAHATLLTPAQAKAWLAHFKDYKLAPLFAQMSRQLPPLPPAGAEALIGDRLGWLSDAFTLRGAFTKLGYQRGQAEDGGIFCEYNKDFISVGVRVRVQFSGNTLPEENNAAALKTLAFHSTDPRHDCYSPLALDQVPPVLLAEAYGDYHAVAAACNGFDPAWEKKVPWA